MLNPFGRMQVVGLIVGLVLGAGVVSPSGVNAANFTGATGSAGNCNSTRTNMADSANHGFYHNSLLTATRDAVEWVRQNVYEATNMTTFVVAAEAADTDVVSQDANYSTVCGRTWHPELNGIIGLATCVSLSPTAGKTNRCEKFVVRYDTSYTSGATGTQRFSLACHEIGHTTGLKHGSTDSCMTGNETTSSSQTGLTNHDIAHLAAL